MNKLEELEAQLQQKHTRTSLSNTIKDTFTSGMREFSKTVSNLFVIPNSGKNQISKKLEKFEKNLILKRRQS